MVFQSKKLLLFFLVFTVFLRCSGPHDGLARKKLPNTPHMDKRHSGSVHGSHDGFGNPGRVADGQPSSQAISSQAISPLSRTTSQAADPRAADPRAFVPSGSFHHAFKGGHYTYFNSAYRPERAPGAEESLSSTSQPLWPWQIRSGTQLEDVDLRLRGFGDPRYVSDEDMRTGWLSDRGIGSHLIFDFPVVWAEQAWEVRLTNGCTFYEGDRPYGYTWYSRVKRARITIFDPTEKIVWDDVIDYKDTFDEQRTDIGDILNGSRVHFRVLEIFAPEDAYRESELRLCVAELGFRTMGNDREEEGRAFHDGSKKMLSEKQEYDRKFAISNDGSFVPSRFHVQHYPHRGDGAAYVSFETIMQHAQLKSPPGMRHAEVDQWCRGLEKILHGATPLEWVASRESARPEHSLLSFLPYPLTNLQPQQLDRVSYKQQVLDMSSTTVLFSDIQPFLFYERTLSSRDVDFDKIVKIYSEDRALSPWLPSFLVGNILEKVEESNPSGHYMFSLGHNWLMVYEISHAFSSSSYVVYREHYSFYNNGRLMGWMGWPEGDRLFLFWEGDRLGHVIKFSPDFSMISVGSA